MRPFLLLLPLTLLLFNVPAIRARDENPPMPTPEERKELEKQAQKLFAGSVKEFQAGKPAQALKLLMEELKIRRRLHGDDSHPAMADSLNAAGFLLNAIGQSSKALPFHEQALVMQRKLYPATEFPEGHTDLATSLSNLGFVQMAMGQAEQALPNFRDALIMQ
jgi:tetratricopeptide (TPR) repeat protein